MSSDNQSQSKGGRPPSAWRRVWPPLAVLAVLLGYFLYAREPGAGPQSASGGIRMAYVEWASELASIHVVQAVMVDYMGVPCEILPVSAAAMWQAVASGDCDGMVAAWLPDTHEEYYEKFKDQIVNLGPNLEGTRNGLVVPDYVTLGSIPQLPAQADQFDDRIVGIDPGAGIMSQAERAIQDYGLTDYTLVSSSGAAMAAALGDAIDQDQWIVVTGWRPHWMFQRWKLKFLDDPKTVFGEEGHISTIVREGLKADHPDVYTFLDQFYWTPSDMEQVMVWNQEPDADPAVSARRWLRENPDRVKEWLKGTGAEKAVDYQRMSQQNSG